MASFSSHNILFADGSESRPGSPLISGTGICQAALRVLREFEPLRGATVADLGCLEGGYAVEFARQGYDVTGWEVHPDNLACLVEVSQRTAGEGLSLGWHGGDVREMAEDYDAVFCCGLLYHLDKPREFLHLLGERTRRVLIVQTHYSEAGSDMNEGLPGHWYGEPPGDRWASHGNARSFWPTRLALVASMRDAGFPLVFQQFDYLTDVVTGRYVDQHGGSQWLSGPGARGMFVGVKPV